MPYSAGEKDAIKQSKKSIEVFAETLSKKLNLKDKSIRVLVEELGGTIAMINPFHRNDSKLDGSMIVDKNSNSFEISLSSLTSDVRDNFTIAHELGHLFLHAKGIDEDMIRFNRYGSNRLEWEANWFAASFLMPKDDFKERCKEYHNSTALLALHYDVSQKAVSIRKESLGIS